MKRLFLPAAAILTLSVGCRPARDFSQGWSFSLDGGPLETVSIPHDWAFEEGYSQDGAQKEQGGYACGGYGVYEKTFSLPSADGKRLFIDFDGVYMNSTVIVNGDTVGFRPYGYISFSYDITASVRRGKNTLKVLVDNTLEPSARWHHGCGIYGDVRLRWENPLHFIKDGIFIRSQSCTMPGSVWTVPVSVETSGEFGHVEAVVTDPSGTEAARVESQEGCFSIDLKDPLLWSPQTPKLYRMDLRLFDREGALCDEESIPFGLKSAEWSPTEGFILNGSQYKLYGVCEHFEAGPLGAAWTRDMMLWKLGLLKEMGCNAIRIAHNPAVPLFYDLCDSLGLLVMDEAFDGWEKKAPEDYGKQAFAFWWERDLSDMVRRDRNHASVFVYSVGNETRSPIAPKLVMTCHGLDPTRSVTSGHSGSKLMDVLGVNGHCERKHWIEGYKPGKQAFVATEAPHTWQVRGFYRTQTWYRDGFPNKGQDPFVIPDLCEKEIFGYDWTAPEGRTSIKQVFNSSYDNATVRLTARHNIALVRDNDWYSGNFRWSGFDYIGEAGFVHGGWPFRAFMGGALDMAGLPKDLFYLYQSEWRPDIDMVHLLPSWTHPDMAPGTLIPVWAYTTGDSVELFLNGASLGVVRKGTAWNEIQCQWMVPWTPGELVAVAYRAGVEIARTSVKTAFEPCGFTMAREELTGGTTLLTFAQVDSCGTFCPYGDSRLYVRLGKEDRMLCFENGSPVDVENPAGALSRRSFFGLSRAFVNGPARDAVAGMICCDRSLKTSSRAYIAVQGPSAYTVKYSLDGSEPSVPYDGKGFEVAAGQTVRAKVYEGRKCILDMVEEMSGGLYWGTPGESIMPETTLHFSKDGTIEWYQENDGGGRDAAVKVSYKALSPASVEVFNNGKSLGTLTLSPEAGSASLMMGLQSGANNITIKLLSLDDVPVISRIDVL